VKRNVQTTRRGSGGRYIRKAHETREAPRRGEGRAGPPVRYLKPSTSPEKRPPMFTPFRLQIAIRQSWAQRQEQFARAITACACGPTRCMPWPGSSQRRFLAGAREETSSRLRCYENRIVRKVGSLDVSILAIATARPVPILEAIASRCVLWRSIASGLCSGGNTDTNSYPDDYQRYDDHEYIDRQPCGRAFRRLGQSLCPLRATLSAGCPKWL
jgi:hypothetical protein